LVAAEQIVRNFSVIRSSADSKVEIDIGQRAPVALRVRRYRRWLAPPLALVLFSTLEPCSFEGELLDDLTTCAGVVLSAVGQWWRLWAWGSNAVVNQSGIRDRGPYALMRHPLYAGNFLILLGLTVTFNNPWAYPLLLFPFAYLYHLITRVDEQRMNAHFGADYQAYAEKNMSRLVPHFKELKVAVSTTAPFNWLYAWRKEYNSLCAVMAGVASLAIYRGALHYGWEQTWHESRAWLLVIGLCGVLAIVLNLKRYIGQKMNQASLQLSPGATPENALAIQDLGDKKTISP